MPSKNASVGVDDVIIWGVKPKRGISGIPIGTDLDSTARSRRSTSRIHVDMVSGCRFSGIVLNSKHKPHLFLAVVADSDVEPDDAAVVV